MHQNFLCPLCLRENTAGSASCVGCGTQLGILGSQNTCCTSCNRPRVPFDRFCHNCGIPLEPICPNCGNKVSKDSRYCPKCGFFCGGGRAGLK